MEYDYDAQKLKLAEIAAIANTALATINCTDSNIADSAVTAFARLTPPAKPEMLIELITLSSMTKRGESRKLGNVYLNWKKLCDLVPDVTIAAAGAAAAPAWLLPFIGLYVWNKLWCGAKEELTVDEATVILALWKNRDGRNKISDELGFEKTNAIRGHLEMPPLNRTAYELAISRLLRMECIEMSDGVIWMREWVKINYE